MRKWKPRRLNSLFQGHTSWWIEEFWTQEAGCCPSLKWGRCRGTGGRKKLGLSLFLMSWAWITQCPRRASASRPRQSPPFLWRGPVSALEPHESSASPLGASFSLSNAFPQKSVKKSVWSHQLCNVPTASPQPEACGVPVAPEAGRALQDFPWIHFQKQREGSHALPSPQPFTFHIGSREGSPESRYENGPHFPPPSGPRHHRTTAAAPTPWATNVPRRSEPLVPTGDILPLTVRGIEGEKLEGKIWKPPWVSSPGKIYLWVFTHEDLKNKAPTWGQTRVILGRQKVSPRGSHTS